ncbi:MAG: DinB family protein [Melioribacteraceae bacterium]|jgi:hypothetical protein|nr:DinB family protein [Melioribacteraceae bacterium]
MNILKSINMLIVERNLILQAVDNLTDEQLFQIPESRKNNILWNLGHIIATQQVLHYTLSHLEMRIPREYFSMFATGSSPIKWDEAPDVQKIKLYLTELPSQFITDYTSGLFKDFRTYKTSTGVVLNCLEDAITFNHFHEGVHTGIIMEMIKQIKT